MNGMLFSRCIDMLLLHTEHGAAYILTVELSISSERILLC